MTPGPVPGTSGTAPAAPLVTVAAAFVAVLAVVLGLLDARLGSEQATEATTARSLAIATTSRVAGGAYGMVLRCDALLVADELAAYRSVLDQMERTGSATPFHSALAAATEQTAAVVDDVTTSLEGALPGWLGLDPASVGAVNAVDCTPDAVNNEAAVGFSLVARQNAAASRASDLGAARGRVALSLTLVAVGAAVLAWCKEDRSAQARRRLGWTGVGLLGAATAWGVSGLLAL